MKYRLLLIGLGFAFYSATNGVAEDLSNDRINENSIALIQAFLNLPESYIGGVSLDDRGDFLSLVSHYGDIDFANGYFRLRGDGARAHDEPASDWFQMKIMHRKKGRPICVIVQSPGAEKPISIISFGTYWRWKDVTEDYLPEEWVGKQSRNFRVAPENEEITIYGNKTIVSGDQEYLRAGPFQAKLIWQDDKFALEHFDDAEFFRDAVRHLPPQYLADVPLEQRDPLWKEIESDPERLDLENGWLHFFSDGSSIKATSMFWVKTLPRSQGPPLVFVHMAKPFAGIQRPANNQTYILEKKGNLWVERNDLLSPETYSLDGHFRPRRDGVIETGAWKKIERNDGQGTAWVPGSRQFDLHWNTRYFYGSRFRKSDAEHEKFTNN